jgi:small nuclear ribonucleoprotein (snRNP)-like protein
MSLMRTLADYESRQVVVVFKGSSTVIGTIIAGDREVAMVRRLDGQLTNVLLPAVMEVFEYEGSFEQERHQWLLGDKKEQEILAGQP